MEVSDCSPVPYSLSDIQLPESPDHHVKSKDTKCIEKKEMDYMTDEVTNEKLHSGNKSKKERKHTFNSSQEDMSGSETKDSSYSNDSPEKIKRKKDKKQSDDSSDAESDRHSSPYKKKSFKYEDASSKARGKIKRKKDRKYPDNSSDSECDKNSISFKKKSFKYEDTSSKTQEKIKRKKDKKHSDESNDAESDKNSSSHKKKSFKNEDISSNLAADSDDHSKGTLYTEKKYSKTQQNTDESENEKSSNSEKYNHHIDSKLKSQDQSKCKKRESRSSSASSKSSDNSPERKHSKKPVATKNKDFVQNDESNQVSDKSSDEKLIKHKKNDSTTESSEGTNISLKKRFKIKRDNVSIEKSSPARESPEKNAAKENIVKKSSSHSISEKPIKQESHKDKEEKLEINYKPRRVVLSNRKLNRKSSEDNSTESKTKKSKWESFASCQKSSQDYGISTDSLRNWFPDFKLTSEHSMELEQDEHSSSAVDEKNGDITHGVSLHEESGMKQESTSQMDVEDSASQEQSFDDAVDLGPVSKIIFIQNLVRPFTLNQLKDLLKQSGKIVEEHFWIDKIKSKCFVMYETEKEAVKARNALNNTRWPSSNPKILSVEFSSIEELENHQRGNEPQPLKPPEPPTVESSDTLEARVSHTVEEHKRKERERRREKDRTKLQAPVREWDKDKIIQDSPERERPPKEEKPRSTEKKEKKESKKRTEDTPAKLLDDLFQKTKSVPCIYWLPLTEEQAKAKEDEKKTRELEREKRNQQKEHEETERRRRARSSSRRREKENRKSSTRSRSPVSRRR